MVNQLPGMNLRAIGIVKNSVKQAPGAGYDWKSVISEIEIDRDLTESLDGLEEFSHIIVIWWMHRAPAGEAPLKVHPRNKQDIALVGLFASRSPQRPNPLGKATVKLLERQGNILKVQGLDAIDGTPVVDIKPYIPGYDSVTDATVPKWITTH